MAKFNLCRSLEFRYYSRDHQCSRNYSLIVRSLPVNPANVNEVTHIHLAYGDRIDQIYVFYLTNSSEFALQCQHGLNPSALNFRQNGTSTTQHHICVKKKRQNEAHKHLLILVICTRFY